MAGLILAACSADPAVRLGEALGVEVAVNETEVDGADWLVLRLEQAVDPEDPAAGTFEQRVSILHRGWEEPVVLHTHGYFDSWEDGQTEPTWLLDANQISVEHRFFGESRPADPDWSKLRLELVAADLHAVVEALRPSYPDAWVSTGYSKGGVTALVHRAAFPDDVDGTVAYVAPFMDRVRDPRFVDASRWQPRPACHDALRAAQLAALDQIEALGPIFEQAWSYERLGVRAALETILVEADWTFWQYVPVERCGEVPPPDAPVEQLAAWVMDLAGDSGSDTFLEGYGPYFWQALAEIGYPDVDLSPFEGRLEADYWDWSASLPAPAPTFDGTTMLRTQTWVEQEAERVMLVYGAYDPWTTGAVDPAPGGDNARYEVPEVGHWASVSALPQPAAGEAMERLWRWAGR